MNTTPILRATNIVKKLGGKTILNDVSLDVHKGDVKVVIGPSGAGKSTFLQCLNYLLPPDSGDIWLEGKKVNARDTRELCALRQQVGMIFQDFNLFDHLTAEENVSIALRKVMGCNKAEARNRALTELSRVGLAKRAALYPAQLSGGSDVMTGYRAFNAVFAKTMPVLSPGFEIETELSIHAVDKRWRIAEVPIDYRDRPEGSESKLNTFSDGMKVLAMIMSLFKDYRPLALFSWLALLFCLLGLIAGIPVIWEFAATGLVPRLPSALLAVALVFVGILAFASGLILDTVVKGTRKEYELQVTQAYERYGRRRA